MVNVPSYVQGRTCKRKNKDRQTDRHDKTEETAEVTTWPKSWLPPPGPPEGRETRTDLCGAKRQRSRSMGDYCLEGLGRWSPGWEEPTVCGWAWVYKKSGCVSEPVSSILHGLCFSSCPALPLCLPVICELSKPFPPQVAFVTVFITVTEPI